MNSQLQEPMNDVFRTPRKRASLLSSTWTLGAERSGQLSGMPFPRLSFAFADHMQHAICLASEKEWKRIRAPSVY